ncbi:MAG TPA: GLPGLI family protein [Saprospiraceae bacterium]|nr:GLPGLI family protein [Saprospiraceae bacterium]
MRVLLYLLLLFVLPVLASAQQNTAGRVTYTETIKLQIEIPEAQREAMKGMLPSEQKSQKVLTFNEKAALYQNADAADAGDLKVEHEEEGAQVNIVIKAPQVMQYTDLNTGKWLRAEEFFGRDFLISGGDKALEWKLTGEQKQIGAHLCQKASLQDSTQQVVAWFAPAIPVSVGPGSFGHLPGLILELEMDKGQRSIRADKVELKAVADSEIAKPTKGKSVTEAEFKKIRDEKLKEMGIEAGSGPKVRMIIQNDERH